MNLSKTFFLGLFLWLGASAHGAPAQASIASLSSSGVTLTSAASLPRLSAPAIRCDLRNATDNALPAALKKGRPGARGTQSTNTPSPTFEHAPGSWHDLQIRRSPDRFSDANDSLPTSSVYLFRSGLSPPSRA